MDNKALILFDGVCNLCNGAVRFIIRHDVHAYFQFASLQSPQAKKVLRDKGIEGEGMNSLALIENGVIYRKSTAVLKIFRHLSGLWKACNLFLVIPRFVRDGIYDFISRNRYRWFGKKSVCMVPKPEWRTRFIDEKPQE